MLKRLFDTDSNYQLTGWLFLRALALIYTAAFLSLAVQIEGLAGPSGILPFSEALGTRYEHFGPAAWFLTPTLFWLSSSDLALLGATLLGVLFSLILLFGRFERLSLIVLFMLYLSLFHAGQEFLNFQWDYLLLESGFLAIFIVGGVNPLSLLLFHWLLFRLRFLSGLSKVLSGDPTWSDLTTLNFYFETQPLPHVGSWFAHQLPQWMHTTGTATVLIAELLVPFFIFLPRPFRLTAALITIVIQLLIIATSNHNFINLLTIALCLFLLDDRFLQRFTPSRLRQRFAAPREYRLPLVGRLALGSVAVLSFSISLLLSLKLFVGMPLSSPLQHYASIGPRYGIGLIYHIFPNMQTERQELVIEGSYDGYHWQPYVFNYKPQALDERPALHIPHDPRLDWMIWFVPPQNERMMKWFNRFMGQLTKNEPKVTALLRENPFANKPPPRYLRVLVYRYHFTRWRERRETGNWWKREYLGVFPYVRPRAP